MSGTVSEKKHGLERFYKAVGNLPILEVTPFQVLDYLNARAQSHGNYSANRDRKNLKAFFNWCRDIYGVMHDPTGPIRKKPHTKRARRLVPIQDILKVILAAQGADRAMVGAYWHTGGRRGEIFRWTWADDVNFEERWVRLGTRKSRGGEMVYEKLWMNEDLRRLLQWQWDHRHPASPYVFCEMNPKSKRYGHPYTTRRKFLKGLCQRAGVEAFGFHDLRHSVAKYLNDLQKVNLKKVQQVLRHRRQTTTEIYVDGNYTDTREAMTLLELERVNEVSGS